MSSRLRSLDSKISFFAFADIITAVSGVLIFVALLLATDLGLPTDSKTTSPNQDLEQQIQEVLAQQVEVDSQNQRLQELLTTANTSPDPDKLQADIKRLKAQLVDEQKKQAVLLQQMNQSQAAIIKRDAELGLTALKAQIDREKQTTKDIESKESEVKSENATLDQHIAGLQSKLLQLRQREGKLWLIPEKGMTTKEPILAIVSSQGVSLERFDHPEKTKQIVSATARTDFEDFVKTMNSSDEYIVFLIRPSGISLFQDLVKTARERNIDVGFDALEEDKDIYFTSPPVLDETVPVSTPSGYTSGSGGYSEPRGGGGVWTGNTGATGGGTAGLSNVPGGQSDGKNGAKSGVGFVGGYNGGASGSQNGRASSGKTGAAGGDANGTGATGETTGGESQGSGSFPSVGTGTGTGGSGSGTSSGRGSGTGAAGNGSGKEGGNGKGKGSGNSDSAKSGNGNAGNGNAQAKTNTPTSDVKKDEPKTNSVPTLKSPIPVAKSWWQRFLEWIWSFFK